MALSSALKDDFTFLQKAVERFGSSTISVVLNSFTPTGSDVENLASAMACFGRPDEGHEGQPLLDMALACQHAGAGELVLNHSQRDGTRTGYAVGQLAELNRQLTIPLIGLGGCGSNEHLSELLLASPLSGVAAGSLFAYAPDSKEVLLNYPLTYQLLKEESRL